MKTEQRKTKLPFADVPRLKTAPRDDRPVVKLADIEGQAVLITGYTEMDGEFGPYLLVNLQLSQEFQHDADQPYHPAGEECVLFLRAQVLSEQLRGVTEFPVVGCVRKVKKPNGRSVWLFVDPDAEFDPFEGQ